MDDVSIIDGRGLFVPKFILFRFSSLVYEHVSYYLTLFLIEMLVKFANKIFTTCKSKNKNISKYLLEDKVIII